MPARKRSSSIASATWRSFSACCWPSRSSASINFKELNGAIAALPAEATFGVISAIALLLFIGATGKSAQIPLYVWLPDAMEGPTPVSALIHAATMVTAGVYLIGRNAVLFAHAPDVLMIVAVIGTATALWAGAIGMVQNDIKRVLAYSTVSQLGYMFMAMGVGAYAAGIFHLFTHAFFKALLFLGSGAVIHALAGEQDLRHMGGLKKELPVTYWTFLIGALAIAGVPGLAGFFSKDEILYRTFAGGHTVLWAVGALTSLMTAFYMFRLVFLAFHGERRQPARSGSAALQSCAMADVSHMHHTRASARRAAIDGDSARRAGDRVGARRLSERAGGASAGRRVSSTFSSRACMFPRWKARTLLPSTPITRSSSSLMIVSSLIALAGIGIAAFLYLKRPEMPDAFAARFPGAYQFLVNKGYIDEMYDAVVVQPVKALSEHVLWKA